MDAKHFLLLIIFSALELTRCEEQTSASNCDECDPYSCHPPGICLAGRVKDYCGCCYECGRREGELCDHPDVSSDTPLGKCGENLQCRMRTDLDPEDKPEATCFCTQTNPMCGSDGVTYENICLLTEARYRRRDGLRAMSREPCRSAPKIVSAPQNQRNSTGTYAAMLCEVCGWPQPVVKWSRYKQDEEPVELPGTDSRIVVHSQRSSIYGDVTSWLMITRLKEEDSGTYKCVAENDMGSASAPANVYVTK